MYKKEKRRAQVQNRSTAHASLGDQIKNCVKRLYLVIKSIWIYVSLKVQYGDKISIHAVNSIKGTLRVELLPESSLQVGSFLMSTGPCYIKCMEQAQCQIGDRVFINHNCSITCAEKITIGNCCNIANNVVIVDHDHKLGTQGVVDGLESASVHIGMNVWIGANSTILKGVSIGDGAVIAAGAVVNQNVPVHEMWGGIPAKKIRNLGEES